MKKRMMLWVWFYFALMLYAVALTSVAVLLPPLVFEFSWVVFKVWAILFVMIESLIFTLAKYFEDDKESEAGE